MRRIAFVLLMLCAVSVFADAAGEVRQTEIAFAKAFADRDQAAFFAFVAPDATFLGQQSTLAGKEAVVKGWSKLLESPAPPFSWKPERVVTNAAGTLGLSTGPVTGKDGKPLGNYSSIWQKQADGKWLIVFDGPGAPACPEAAK